MLSRERGPGRKSVVRAQHWPSHWRLPGTEPGRWGRQDLSLNREEDRLRRKLHKDAEGMGHGKSEMSADKETDSFLSKTPSPEDSSFSVRTHSLELYFSQDLVLSQQVFLIS